MVGLVVVVVPAITLVLTMRAQSRREPLGRSQRVLSVRREVRLVTVGPDEAGLLVGYTDGPPPPWLPTPASPPREIVGTVLLRLDPSARSTTEMLARWQRHDVKLAPLPPPHEALFEIHESRKSVILVRQVKAP